MIFYVERKKNENWEIVRNNMKKKIFSMAISQKIKRIIGLYEFVTDNEPSF